jgi:transposase
MKDQETQQRFVELRTQSWSFERIARELDVSKSTLINWSRKFRFTIQNQRAIQLEALQEQLLASRESRARALAEQLRAIEAELAKRNVAELSTSRLFALAESFRRQILHETDELLFSSPLKEIPEEEYHEHTHEWKP